MHKHIAIVGPTASGKTKLAISVAKRLNLEILSCDSVSVYKGLDIGSSKPTSEEQKEVKHHMIDIVDPCVDYNVKQYEEDSRQLLNSQKMLIVGGTGFYLQALLYGTFDAPATDTTLLKELELIERQRGLQYLREELKKIDPKTESGIEKNDRYRILRALVVFKLTGKTMSYYREKHSKNKLNRDIAIYVLQVDKDKLRKNIAKRTQNMFKEGFIEEVRGLLKRCGPNVKSLNSVGYKEVVEYLGGNFDFNSLVEKINTNTYKLAKRQITWFKRLKNASFLDAKSIYERILDL